MPPAADQISAPAPAPPPSIPFGLDSMEPIRTHGGGLIMPDLPPAALTKNAHKERLNASASWAELVLVDWFKRIAVFGVSAQFDIDRFERATQALWRLTAVAKSVAAFDDTTNLPAPPDSPLGPRTSTSATPPPVSNPDLNQENPSSLGPRTSTSADAPSSNTETPSQTAPTADTPSPSPSPRFALRTPPLSIPTPDSPSPSPSPSPRSALRTPHLSASTPDSPSPSPSPSSALRTPHLTAPAVRAVPSCPTLSFEGIETYLDRTEADLAEARRPTPPVLDLPPTPASPTNALPARRGYTPPAAPPQDSHPASAPQFSKSPVPPWPPSPPDPARSVLKSQHFIISTM